VLIDYRLRLHCATRQKDAEVLLCALLDVFELFVWYGKALSSQHGTIGCCMFFHSVEELGIVQSGGMGAFEHVEIVGQRGSMSACITHAGHACITHAGHANVFSLRMYACV
jgi:hypothetical protein